MLGALKAEPALLVTPSSQQSEQDGGLLTAQNRSLRPQKQRCSSSMPISGANHSERHR
jgi:hypothetical protein